MSLIPAIPYANNLLLHASFSILLTIIFSFLKIPVLFLHGLHTYIHPDDVNPTSNSSSGIKAAIRRPGSIDSDPPPKPKKKSMDNKFEFDESKAQIFRLKLNEGHLQSRIYFKEFYSAFNSTLIALLSLLLHRFLTLDETSGFVRNGGMIPLLLGLVSVFRISLLMIRAGFERSAHKKLEKHFSFVVGFLGFLLGLTIVFGAIPPNWIFDFSFESLDGLSKLCLSLFMGFIVGYLYIPSLRNAKAFWLGTDQVRSSLAIVSCGWFSRMVLYANFLMPIVTSLLWMPPFSDLLVDDKSRAVGKRGQAFSLAGHVGMPRSDFDSLRHWCLSITGLLQLLAARPNVQIFLNEAVLCWYQRLHASKVPDLDYSRAKVFLHNHYLCLVVVQFMAPAAVVLLLLGFRQIDFFKGIRISYEFFPYSVLVKDVGLFVTWWIIFVWATFSLAIISLYRRGTLYVS